MNDNFEVNLMILVFFVGVFFGFVFGYLVYAVRLFS